MAGVATGAAGWEGGWNDRFRTKTTQPVPLGTVCTDARIVRIGLFGATRSELSGPVPLTWMRWRLQVILRVLLGTDSSCGVRRRVESAQSV